MLRELAEVTGSALGATALCILLLYAVGLVDY